MDSNRIEFANSLRGFAALAVAFGHLAALFWLLRSVVSHYTGIPAMAAPDPIPLFTKVAMWSGINLGAFGVSIFFLISGMVIPISLAKSSSLRFLAARVMRLFPTYAACFTVVLCAIGIGTWYFKAPWPLETKDIAFHFVPGLRAVANTRDIDSVVWTLEIEVCFYLICALAGDLFRQQSVLLFLIPATLAIMASLHSSLPDTFLVSRAPYLTFMFVGVCFYFLYIKRLSAFQAVAVFSIAIGSTVVAWLSVLGVHFLIEVGRAYLLGAAVFSFSFRFPEFVPKGRVARFMADISYPFYLVHAIPGYVLMRITMDVGGIPRTIALAAAFALAISTATVIHYLVEMPTRRLSGKIQSGNRSDVLPRKVSVPGSIPQK